MSLKSSKRSGTSPSIRKNSALEEPIVYKYRSRLYWHVPQDKIAELGTAVEYRWWMAKQGKPVEGW